MFTQNEFIRRGKIYYDEITAQARRKEDDRRHITHRILNSRRKNDGYFDAFASGNMNVPGEDNKRRPGAMQETVKISTKTGKSALMNQLNSSKPKQSIKPFMQL